VRRFLLRLYPESWRDRYGDEFASILDDRSLTPAAVADVVMGAIDAHLRRRGREVALLGRVGRRRAVGAAAVLGGLAWTAGLFLAMFDPSGAPWAMRTAFFHANPIVPLLGSPIAIVGTVLLLVALVGLAASRRGDHVLLSWVVALLPIVGAVVSLFGLLALPGLQRQTYSVDSDAGEVWVSGMLLMVGGTGLFCLANLVRSSPHWPASVLLFGSGLMLSMVLGASLPLTSGLMKASWYLGAFYIGLLAHAIGWVAIGVVEWRRPPISSGRRASSLGGRRIA
jgi:MFS family permease